MRENIIFSTESSEYFAQLVAKGLCAKIGGVERDRFGDGERYLRLEDDDRMSLFGKDVVFVTSVVTDDDFTEVQRLGSAISKYGARRIIYVIPFEAYTTMERAVKPNEIVTAKIVARQLSQLPHGDLRNCFLFMDLHTAGFVHYFEGECLRFELYAEEVLSETLKGLQLSNFMFCSADLGRPKWVETFAKKFGTEMAFIRKTRDGEKTEVHEVIGDVSGKTVVIYDDMIRSGGSLVKAANSYLDHGAVEVHAIASHLALNDEESFRRLDNSRIKTIITTNSHPMSQHLLVKFSPKYIVKDVSSLFVEAVTKLQH